MKVSSPYKESLSPKDNDRIIDTINNKALSEDAGIAIGQGSSPYSNPISLKDKSRIKDTAINKWICKDVSSVIHKVSSPYNNIHFPQKIMI